MEWDGFIYYDDDYYDVEDDAFEENYDECVGDIYLVDGDNVITEVLRHSFDPRAKVSIYVTNENLYEKVRLYSYKAKVIKVPKGDQAVDNRIKSYLGRVVNAGYNGRIIIVSKDKGYDELIKKYRKRYNLRNNKLCRISSI